MKYLLLALMLMAQSVAATMVNFSWTNAVVDVNGDPISPSDIAGVTLYCGLSPNTPVPTAPMTSYLPSSGGIPQTTFSFPWTNTAVTQIWCSMSTTSADGSEGPKSTEISIDPNQRTQTMVIGAPVIFTITVVP